MATRKILIADEMDSFLAEEKTILSRREFEIFATKSGREALEIHKKERVDLILADLNLPDLAGDELARLIRSDPALRKVSILIISTQRRADIDRCATSSANDIITRPIEEKRLLEKIARLVNVPPRKALRVLIKAQVKGYFGQDSFFGLTHNLSVNGLFMETERVLAKGDLVSFSFFLPENERVQAEGTVVRSVKLEKMFQYGIEFTHLTEKDKRQIDEFVSTEAPPGPP
jgi:two-component system chemotaxis response regulator CheY